MVKAACQVSATPSTSRVAVPDTKSEWMRNRARFSKIKRKDLTRIEVEGMKGYVHNIERAANQNATFRTVLYTAKNCQLVVMSLKPGEDIGAEVHQLDQLLRVEEGEGRAVLDGVEHRIKPGFAILVPAGARHNIINGPSGPMKLYTLYAPPNHRDGVVHATKADAEADEEHFDGKTTE